MNNESKKHTPALPNADTRRGGKNPSCAGLTSCTSPEVQSHQTENSHTGVSLDCVPSEHSGMIPKERVHYKSGELVRVIKGDFTGVIGKVARASGQQRVAIDIDGLGTFVTAYIPNDFMEKLRNYEDL